MHRLGYLSQFLGHFFLAILLPSGQKLGQLYQTLADTVKVFRNTAEKLLRFIWYGFFITVHLRVIKHVSKVNNFEKICLLIRDLFFLELFHVTQVDSM